MPQMICGALIGRCLALVMMGFQNWSGMFYYVSKGEDSLWSPFYQSFFGYNNGPLKQDVAFTSRGFMDPGVAGVIGAAAFLGGSGRVTLFTVVMMVEITGDPLMIFPVGVATIVAVLVGNYFNHGLYHALIDVQSLPFLGDHYELPRTLRVKDMMPRNAVITIPLKGGREAVEKVTAGNDYTGFPVVNSHGVVLGIAERNHLDDMMSSGSNDVGSVTDFHPITVREGYPLQMAFQLFKQMELKHLIVVDNAHKPLAVLTRFAFLDWRVQERVGADRMENLRAESNTGMRRPSIAADFNPSGLSDGPRGSRRTSILQWFSNSEAGQTGNSGASLQGARRGSAQ